ncbi:MAG TPA: histidine kinase [Agriterribacter sp.]|nr:histidine kinase [Agriterribacter sp.]
MKNFIRKTCVAAICVLLLGPVTAQLPEYHLQVFDYPNGIRPDNVVALAKDKRGMLWILYWSQVQRFDGKEVQNYRPPGRLGSILCDKKGRIWVTSDKEAFIFSEKTGTFEKVGIEDQGTQRDIGQIVELPDGRIWLQTDGGFAQFNDQVVQFEPVGGRFSSSSIMDTDVCALLGNVLFVHNSRFIYQYNISTGETDSLPGGALYGIYPVSEDSILVSSRYATAQWYRFSNRSITAATLGNGAAGVFTMRHMTPVSSSRFLVATSEGIYEYNASNRHFVKQNFFLNGNKVATKEYASFILCDETTGYGWIATTDGIARFAFRNQPMGYVRPKQMNDEISAVVNDVRRMVQDESGDMWLATGYGFACWKKSRNEWEIFPPAKNDSTRLSHESIRGMVYDGKFLILGPTGKGLWLFNIKTHQYKRPVYESDETRRLSENDFVNEITTLKNGNHVILASRGIYIMDGKTYLIRRLNHPAFGKRGASFCGQGDDGIVWIAGDKGVYCFDAELNYLLTVPEHFGNNVVTYGFAGFVMKDNGVLLSDTKGLFSLHYNNGEVTTRKVSPVFDNLILYAIYQDRNGIIWASSEKGIYRFDPTSSKLNLFDRSDNVQGYAFNRNCWFRDKDDILYFGGLNGINYWQPETFSAPFQSFEAYISEVSISNMDYSMYAFDTLAPVKYSDRSMSVVFAAVYFNNPEKVKYRYKLEGLDTDWKEIGSGNIVRFSSLAPGNYLLKMEASLNQVDWKPSSNTLAFQILNPFWMTWWFILLCVLLFSAIIFRVINNHRRKIKMHQEELEAAQAIHQISTCIYESNDIDNILHEMVKNCVAKLNIDDCVIYKTDSVWQVLRCKATHHVPPQSVEPVNIAAGNGIAAEVAMKGKATILNHHFAENSNQQPLPVYLSEIAVPVIVDEKVWGVIYGGKKKRNFFTPKHLSVITAIASLCANKIVKLKNEREKERAEALIMNTRQKMAEAEMQALRAQMNPHFIFNCLNSINRYIVKSDQATASLYLTRFARLIRLILDNSNNKYISLSSELEALQLYIEMEGIRFEKKFTCEISCAPDVFPESVNVPPLIIQPYVENAIWHGLLHKSSEGHLTIQISRKGKNILQCIIEDNGVGRQKAEELKGKTAFSRKSLGMQLTENRLVLMGRQAGTNASVGIEDIQDEQGLALGTKVTLNIPVDEV